MPERQGLAGKIREKIPTKSSLMALGAAGSIAFIGCSQDSDVARGTESIEPTATVRLIEKPTETYLTPPLVPITPEPTVVATATIEAVSEPTAVIEQRGESIGDVHVNGVSIKDLWANYHASVKPQIFPTLLPFSNVLARGSGDDSERVEPTPVNVEFLLTGAKQREAWWENTLPVRVLIPKIGIDSEVVIAKKIPSPRADGEPIEQYDDLDVYCRDNSCTFETPEFGIATPEDLLKNGEHTMLVFIAHSYSGVERQLMADLPNLDKGDVNTFLGPSGEVQKCVVDEFAVVPYVLRPEEGEDKPKNMAFTVDRDEILFQTTAVYKDVWLINRDLALSKVEKQPEYFTDHMAFWVSCDPLDN